MAFHREVVAPTAAVDHRRVVGAWLRNALHVDAARAGRATDAHPICLRLGHAIGVSQGSDKEPRRGAYCPRPSNRTTVVWCQRAPRAGTPSALSRSTMARVVARRCIARMRWTTACSAGTATNLPSPSSRQP